jgi:hypothetical protein
MAQRRFRSDPGRWLPPPAIPITGGHRVRLSMATIAASLEVAAVVSMGLPLDPAPGLLVRSIAWRAETVNDLFPVLKADLELHTTTEPMLRLVGSYTPPLSVLGALTDQVVGRHLATEVVRGFLTVVARHLTVQRDTEHTVASVMPSGHRVSDSRGPSRRGDTSIQGAP